MNEGTLMHVGKHFNVKSFENRSIPGGYKWCELNNSRILLPTFNVLKHCTSHFCYSWVRTLKINPIFVKGIFWISAKGRYNEVTLDHKKVFQAVNPEGKADTADRKQAAEIKEKPRKSKGTGRVWIMSEVGNWAGGPVAAGLTRWKQSGRRRWSKLAGKWETPPEIVKYK